LQVSANIKQMHPQIKQICNDLNTKKSAEENKEKKDTDGIPLFQIELTILSSEIENSKLV
jgi:hypothetical protein